MVALVAVVLAVLAYQTRRQTVRAFFVDAAGEASLPAPGEGPGLEPATHVRVVLLDGLSAAHADTLPNLSRFCSDGLRLTVDNGFPTVSLPVQHVLWTGLTQQQSGLWYRIPGLEQPPTDSLPVAVEGSRGVAESHAEIVNSFGFEFAMPPTGEDRWSPEEFVGAANEVVASSARLAFVHVLRIDEAGHAHGGASAEYADAATWADERLGEWLALGPEGTRWFVLADHGHLPGGGHGGAEPHIRLVRACMMGGPDEDLPASGELHLIDFARAVRDSVDIDPAEGAAGRPIVAALSSPELGATLPEPSTLRWSVAVLVLAGSLALARTFGRGSWLSAPWWLAAAYLCFMLWHGLPTLSRPAVYPPYGRDILLAGLPGFVILAVQGWRLAGHLVWWRAAAALLAPGLGVALACALLCGAVQYAVGLTGAPPLMPTWTAQTSVALSFCLGASSSLALVSAAVAARSRARRE